jgi:serpin B
MKKILPMVSCAAALAVGAGCAADEPPVTVDEARSHKERDTTPEVSEADRKALADGNAAFAIALYRQVEAKHPNLVFSPVSISTALAMTWAGARGDTEKEMATALRFTLPQERLHPAMNELTAALAARGEGKQGADGKPFRLRIVNSTWAQKDFTLEPGFLDVLGESYGAGVNLLNFAAEPEPARLKINQWVSQQTEDRIKDLIPQGVINPLTRLVLTNAVYFNAAWKAPFSKPTGNAPFTLRDGSTVNVPMMHHDAGFRAAALRELATAVALPYQDERLSMLVVLPEEGKLAAVEEALATRGLADIDAALTMQPVLLSLPRFKFETPIPLRPELSALGMPVAFAAGEADFTGINRESDLYIQAVLHKAFIAVAEKGTEAAAATAVVAGATSAPQGLTINVNRPFLFFIRDDATGAILFMGRVSDPSKS